MNFLDLYSQLQGSSGQASVRISVRLLDQLCRYIESLAPERVYKIRIEPQSDNRFRIRAQLSNAVHQWLGSLFLRVLSEEGIDIQIEQGRGTHAAPNLRGWMDTTVVGKSVAVPRLVDVINEGLDAGKVFTVRDTEWLGWTDFRIYLTMDPFLLLRRYLPAALVNHVGELRWQSSKDAFVVDVRWQYPADSSPATHQKR